MNKKQTVQINESSVNPKLLIILSMLTIAIFSTIYITIGNPFDLICLIIVFAFVFCFIMLAREYKNIDDYTLEKITLTNDEIIITAYFKSKKTDLKFNKNDIQNFIVNFGNTSDSPIMYGKGCAYKHYTIQIIIKLQQDDEYIYTGYFKSSEKIKAIFEMAKDIPNFSYNVAPSCLSYFSEEIEKIANTGKSLNLIDIYNNPNISISEKKDIFFVIIGILFVILLVILQKL